MKPEQCIAKIIKEHGMTIKFVSNKTGIPYAHLQTSLTGRREMRADEFIDICRFLDLDPMAIGHSCQRDQDYAI